MDSSGMKIPLMKTNGNLTSEKSIITVAGVSEGGADRRAPREEKQKEDNTMLSNIIGKLITGVPANKPTATGTVDINSPKIAEANMSPKIIVATVTGAETNRSKVFMRVSQGAITGTTDVEVKKTLMPNMPGTRKLRERFRPIEKARNRKRGSKRPNIITGPLQ